jgi:CBS domain-containing protein
MKVEEIMTSPVVTVGLGTPLKQVAALMAEREISGVPVVEDGVVVGVVSESDVVAKEHAPDAIRRHLLRHGPTREERLIEASTAGDAMSAPPITIEPWMSVSAAAWLMVERDVNRLPVVEHDQLFGIVARADLVRAFARSDAEIGKEIGEEVLPSLGLSPNDVFVSVEQGEVTLAGELESESDVESLPRAVRHVTGVVRVHSQLHTRDIVSIHGREGGAP